MIYESSIRRLGPTAYSNAQVDAWASYASESGFENWIASAKTFVAVARNGGIIGFAGLAGNGHVSAVFVAPAYHRMGVGSELLTTILSYAQSMGVEKITSHASEFSKPLFEKYGFTVSEIEHTQVKGVSIFRYSMQTIIIPGVRAHLPSCRA